MGESRGLGQLLLIRPLFISIAPHPVFLVPSLIIIHVDEKDGRVRATYRP